MKGVFETVMLFGIVVFVVLLGIMGQSFITSSQTAGGFVNGTSGANVTGIQTGTSLVTPPVCGFNATGIEIVDGLIGGAVCIGEYIGFLFGFVGLTSENPILNAFYVGAVAVMGLLAFRMIRGN